MSDDARDPVCGMTIDAETGLSVVHEGRTYYFDSEYGRDAFLRQPERYVATEPLSPGTVTDAPTRRIAYFSMEVAIDPRLPTYSGGLGVLAGDTLRSAADLRVPVVGVTLLYSKGYFRQQLDGEGEQTEQPVSWDPSQMLRRLEPTVPVTIEGRVIHVCAWQYDIVGQAGFQVPLILLDTNLPENEARDRELTAFLYGGDERYRLAQEVVLGVGGVRMLAALAYRGIERYHLNEGHASLLALELLRGETGPEILARRIDAVRRLCVFTTHTPVPAGHDQFPYDLVRSVLELRPREPELLHLRLHPHAVVPHDLGRQDRRRERAEAGQGRPDGGLISGRRVAGGTPLRLEEPLATPGVAGLVEEVEREDAMDLLICEVKEGRGRLSAPTRSPPVDGAGFPRRVG